MAEKLHSIRCKFCGKLLGLIRVDKGMLEIKCHRCKKTNHIHFGPTGEPPKKGKK